MQYEIVCYNYVGFIKKVKQLDSVYGFMSIENGNYSGQDCAELHSPYEIVVVTGKNPSPQVILHGFLLVTMKVLNSYEK